MYPRTTRRSIKTSLFQKENRTFECSRPFLIPGSGGGAPCTVRRAGGKDRSPVSTQASTLTTGSRTLDYNHRSPITREVSAVKKQDSLCFGWLSKAGIS